MIKKSAGLIIIILIGLSIIAPFFTYAESQLEINPPKVEVNFFYSETCPHCKAENTFLDQIASDYPDVIINRYLTTDSEHRQLLIKKT